MTNFITLVHELYSLVQSEILACRHSSCKYVFVCLQLVTRTVLVVVKYMEEGNAIQLA